MSIIIIIIYYVMEIKVSTQADCLLLFNLLFVLIYLFSIRNL